MTVKTEIGNIPRGHHLTTLTTKIKGHELRIRNILNNIGKIPIEDT